MLYEHNVRNWETSILQNIFWKYSHWEVDILDGYRYSEKSTKKIT